MAGRKNSKWLETMIAKHGSREAVAEIQAAKGAKGGKKSRDGGFASPIGCRCELIEEVHGHQRCAGIKGGLKSRRTKAKGDK